MHPLVRDLYKRFITVAQDYPGGWHAVRPKVKKAFFQQKHLTDEVDIKQAVNRGRYMTREMLGVINLKKYRTMRHRYMPWD